MPRIMYIICGVILIVAGVFGLFLPFLQGIIMIAAGLALINGTSIKQAFAQLRRKLKR